MMAPKRHLFFWDNRPRNGIDEWSEAEVLKLTKEEDSMAKKFSDDQFDNQREDRTVQGSDKGIRKIRPFLFAMLGGFVGSVIVLLLERLL